MLCKFRNNQLKSHFFYKIPNIKKHVTFFENLIADLKSSQKNASETVFILTRSFHKNFNIGKLHCVGVGGVSDYLQILHRPIFYQDIYQKKQNAEKISPFNAFLTVCCPKSQNLLFCLQCNVNKNKDSSFWSILTFS